MKSDNKQMMEALSMAGNMGFCIAVNAGVGLLLGKAVDKFAGTSPWGLAAGVALGIIAGLRSACRRAVEIQDDGEKEKRG